MPSLVRIILILKKKKKKTAAAWPLLLLYFFIPREIRRRRQWHPTPVLLPGKFHGQRSLVGCRLWGRFVWDTIGQLHFHFSLFMHWRRKWQPTPVFLPGESQGQGSLVAAVYGITQSRTGLKRLSSSSREIRKPVPMVASSLVIPGL